MPKTTPKVAISEMQVSGNPVESGFFGLVSTVESAMRAIAEECK